MIYIFMGIAAFILFVLYDINSIILKNKLLKCSFFAGFILLAVSTFGLVWSTRDLIKLNLINILLNGCLSAVFFFLLIYSLFFAIPFKNTYIAKEEASKVCKRGVYALCRHPGVLWFTGFYLFLGLALRQPLLFTAAGIFSFLNILYVLFQDNWTFMKSFPDYGAYKIDTPFLIPNRQSIKRCIKTLYKKGTDNYEL